MKIAMTWFEGPYRTAVTGAPDRCGVRAAYLLERARGGRCGSGLTAASCGLSEIIRHRRDAHPPDEAVVVSFFILSTFRARSRLDVYQLARKHLDDLDAAATMKRRLEERHDRAEVKALEAFQQRQSNGPVRAKRAGRTAASAARSPNL